MAALMKEVSTRVVARMASRVRRAEPMARHTTWRAGGSADRWFQPRDLRDLCAFLEQLSPTEAIYWVGRGSNLLVRDGGLRGVVICTRDLNRLEFDPQGGLWAEAGVPCPRMARGAARLGLAGVEFLAGVPGSLGGALAMNAGAHGNELWRLVTEVETVDRSGRLRRCSASDFQAAYRSLRRVSGEARNEWFTGACLALKMDSAAVVRERMLEQLRHRTATQPRSLYSCGSVFRNPPGEHAARLIELCGLKGAAEGCARVSPRHANFIVNEGGAAAADIERLINRVRREVLKRTGVTLETEVVIIGEAVPPPGEQW